MEFEGKILRPGWGEKVPGNMNVGKMGKPLDTNDK